MNSPRLLIPSLILWITFSTNSVRAEDNRCGPRSLLVAACASGLNVSEHEIDRLFPDFELQASISELELAAHELGLATVAMRWANALPSLAESTAILPIGDTDGRRHFVVALQSQSGRILLLDFPNEAEWISTSDLISHAKWDGTALHIAATPAALKAFQPSKLRICSQSILTVLTVILTIGFLCQHRSWHFVDRRKQLLHRRSGMSLIEVLVAMSVLGLLLSLIAPAIQSSREAARRIQCRNNLKQLSLACQAHHAIYGHFPAAAIPFSSAVGPSNEVNLSVHARLLPYLDQAPLFRKLDQNEDGLGSTNDPPTSSRNPQFIGLRMGIFECSSDGVPPGATNYRVCVGTGPGTWDWPISMQAKVGAFATRAKADRDMIDGLSTTAFFSEKLVGDQNPATYTANRDYFMTPTPVKMDEPADAEIACQLPVGAVVTSVSFGGSTWLLSGYDHTWYNHVFPPNAATPDCSEGRGPLQALAGAFTARSLHNGGVHVAFGDGSVRFVANSVNLAVWRAISSRNGQEPVTLDF